MFQKRKILTNDQEGRFYLQPGASLQTVARVNGNVSVYCGDTVVRFVDNNFPGGTIQLPLHTGIWFDGIDTPTPINVTCTNALSKVAAWQ